MFRRYVCVRQTDQSDCGTAALATICRHYGRPLGLEQMRDLAGTDRVGTNLHGLVQAAEQLGFAVKAVKGPFESLVHVPFPAIAHIHTPEGLGHFVVIHHVSRCEVVLADPAKGVVTLSAEEFQRQWTGYLLLLAPDASAPVARGTTPVGPLRRLLGLLSGHLSILVEGAICAILMTILGVSSSYFVQHLVDNVLVRNETRLLNALGVGMVLIVVFRTLFGILREYLLVHVGRRVDLALIAGFSRHLLRLPMKFYEMRQVGEILSRVQDMAKVREAISGTTTSAVVDGTLVVVLLGLLWYYDPRLTLVATAFMPLLVLSVVLHHPAVKRRSREAMEHGAQLSAHLIEDVSAVETVKAFGIERRRSEESEHRLAKFIQSAFALQRLGVSMNGATLLVTALAGVVVLWYGGHRVMAGALSIGQLMFFSSLLGYLLEPLERMASVNLRLQDALVAVDRLYQILDVEPESASGAKKAQFTRLENGIVLDGVAFKYGCRANVLENLNLHIPAGKTVAIVGESGSGKSTLLKLLLGMYPPNSGQLLLDGVDVRDIDLASLRKRVGLVSQEPFIFNGTLRENIALGRPQAPLDEIARAIRAAGLETFVQSLPQRFDTVIGERGANLSGGQRQRLAIARVLLMNPDIFIFDEATSHLDVATERSIQENLRTLFAGKTVVLVAHRLSTIKNADLIYVLREGRVIEAGTHRQLLAQGGYYTTLCHTQSAADDAPADNAAPTTTAIRESLQPGNRLNGRNHHAYPTN